MKRAQRARLLERLDLDPTLAIFRFALEPEVPPFEAGQYVTLGTRTAVGEELWRPYSIASAPEERRWVELYVRLAPHHAGSLTAELWRTAPGDELAWLSIKGRFTMVERRPDGAPDVRVLLLVAGGTGVAPFVSYVRHLRALGWPRRVVLCHGASHVVELGYRDLFERCAGERFAYLPTISRPDAEANRGWTGNVGRVHTLLQRAAGEPLSPVERALRAPLDPATCFVHVCGFAGTVAAAAETLSPLGFRTKPKPHEDGSYDLAFESYG